MSLSVTKPAQSKPDQNRRNFIRLGAALLGTAAVPASVRAEDKPKRQLPTQGIDMEKWKKLKGEAYPKGTEKTPGVCQLPGPNAKRNWPDKDKYACLLYTSPSPRDRG